MRRYFFIAWALFSCLTLLGCTTRVRTVSLNTDLTREAWMQEVDANPAKWTRGADRWFLTGDATVIQAMPRLPGGVMSTTKINAPQFSDIRANGDFEVQIFGVDGGENTVYVYGPNEAVRQVSITLKGGILCIDQAPKLKYPMQNVIVRIGVRQLNSLTQLGRGRIEGIRLRSNHLVIMSKGSGNIYLAGPVNLAKVVNWGAGCVTVLGAQTPRLDIMTNGTGMTNVSGLVGVHTIIHKGRTDINIIGANTRDLKIYASGRGKIGIRGTVGLKEVKASDYTRVYVCNVISDCLYAYAHGQARIGLAGAVDKVYIDAFQSSCVGGRFLCTRTAYVRSHDNAHINIASTDKIFASATENSSIYIFGSPNMVSQFMSGKGSIIPIWTRGLAYCPLVRADRPMPVPHYKGEG